MQLAAAITLLTVLWAAVCLYAHGYANTIDYVALRLHQHARTVREMQARRAAQLSERWVRDLES